MLLTYTYIKVLSVGSIVDSLGDSKMKKSIIVTAAAVSFSVAVAMANANTTQLPTSAKSMIHLTACAGGCCAAGCCAGDCAGGCCGGCGGDDGSDS